MGMAGLAGQTGSNWAWSMQAAGLPSLRGVFFKPSRAPLLQSTHPRCLQAGVRPRRQARQRLRAPPRLGRARPQLGKLRLGRAPRHLGRAPPLLEAGRLGLERAKAGARGIDGRGQLGGAGAGGLGVAGGRGLGGPRRVLWSFHSATHATRKQNDEKPFRDAYATQAVQCASPLVEAKLRATSATALQPLRAPTSCSLASRPSCSRLPASRRSASVAAAWAAAASSWGRVLGRKPRGQQPKTQETGIVRPSQGRLPRKRLETRSHSRSNQLPPP
jgi:hypothetical protein